MAKRITYVDEDGLSKHERARLKAMKPLVQAAMDQAALERTLAAGQKLVDAERQHDADLLAAARNAFPELRRRASASQPPRAEPVASANVAGEGESSGGASLSPAAHNAGWYRRVNGSPVVKDSAPSRVSAWQNYEPPNRGEPGQHFISDLESGPAPFPAGLNIRD